MLKLENKPVILCQCDIMKREAEYVADVAYGIPMSQIIVRDFVEPRVVLKLGEDEFTNDGILRGSCHKCSSEYEDIIERII